MDAHALRGYGVLAGALHTFGTLDLDSDPHKDLYRLSCERSRSGRSRHQSPIFCVVRMAWTAIEMYAL
jgi:hypothetical protein